MPLKIRQKLLAAFGVMLIPILGLLAISGYNGMIIYRALHEVGEISVEVGLVSDLIIATEMSLMPPNDYLITGDAGERERFKELDADVEAAFSNLMGLHIVQETTEEVFLLNEARKDYKRVKALAEEILAIKEPVGSRAGAKLMGEMDSIARDEILVHLMEYREIDREEFEEAVEVADRAWRRSWLIMGVGAFILIGTGIGFAFIYSRVFVRPIKEIHNGAESIAGGDFKTWVDVSTGDEIEQLSNAMNEMAAQLDEFYSGLEDKVRERTRELRERVEELERFRKATVNREFRMKELKDENKRLKARIGELEGG